MTPTRKPKFDLYAIWIRDWHGGWNNEGWYCLQGRYSYEDAREMISRHFTDDAGKCRAKLRKVQ